MRWTRRFLQDALRSRGLRPRKSLGQNFIVDENFLTALARDTGATKEDGIVEVGSGPGNLTDHLAAIAGHVWAFEVDEPLQALSKELLSQRGNVTWVAADGAELDHRVDPENWKRIRVVSNLPYFDWQRLVLALLSTKLPAASFTFMVQTDLYERLRAEPGTKDYGPMAVLLQGACEIRRLRRAGRELFLPVPRVDSTVFQVIRRERVDFVDLEARLRLLFSQRRKKSPLAGGRRVEELPPSELLPLARKL